MSFSTHRCVALEASSVSFSRTERKQTGGDTTFAVAIFCRVVVVDLGRTVLSDASCLLPANIVDESKIRSIEQQGLSSITRCSLKVHLNKSRNQKIDWQFAMRFPLLYYIFLTTIWLPLFHVYKLDESVQQLLYRLDEILLSAFLYQGYFVFRLYTVLSLRI